MSTYRSADSPEWLRNGLGGINRLSRAAMGEDLVWILPTWVLPGVVTLHGLPVIHSGDFAHPFLAHRLVDADSPGIDPVDASEGTR